MTGETFANPSEDEIRALLERARRIAVVGLSPKPHRDSNRVSLYMQERGYEIIPVYPRAERILGAPVYRRVQDIPGSIDLVDVFRRSEALPEVTEDALAAGAKAIWFQLGCVHPGAAARAQENGVSVVMDRCLMIDHARLLGSSRRRA